MQELTVWHCKLLQGASDAAAEKARPLSLAVACATKGEAPSAAAVIVDAQTAKHACSQPFSCMMMLRQFGVALEGCVLFTLTVLGCIRRHDVYGAVG